MTACTGKLVIQFLTGDNNNINNNNNNNNNDNSNNNIHEKITRF